MLSLRVGKFRLPLLSVALGLSACAQHAGTPSTSTPNTAEPGSTQGLAEAYVSQQAGVPAERVAEATKAKLLQDFERLKAAAAAEDAIADTSTRQIIELQRIESLAHAGAERAGVFAKPSNEELQAQYEEYAASLPPKEFHVTHILVASESMGQVLITELQGGADFAKLAREKSADDSNARGGDLGWIAPGKLPVEFTAAVAVLKPGQFTPHPVHTIYGWHVIKLLELRSSAAPPIDQVKAQLIVDLQQQRYAKFLEDVAARTAHH
jgi:peptidyl-prolyl cis-trans isomerase C